MNKFIRLLKTFGIDARLEMKADRFASYFLSFICYLSAFIYSEKAACYLIV